MHRLNLSSFHFPFDSVIIFSCLKLYFSPLLITRKNIDRYYHFLEICGPISVIKKIHSFQTTYGPDPRDSITVSSWVGWLLHTHIINMLIHTYTYILDKYRRDDNRRSDKDARKIRCRKDFFNNILPLTLLQGFERVVQGLHVRGSWKPNINCNILTPLLWLSRCVFLVL